jgi:signal peptidase I
MRGGALTYWNGLQGPRVAPAPVAGRRGGLALTALTGALVLAAVAVAATRLAGLEPLTVLSGSMQPAIDRGDLVLVDRAPASTARPGDVVTFASPDGRDRTLTHRVVRVQRRGGQLAFVTKGDANPVGERWSIPPDGRIGHVRAVVPWAGYAAHPLAAGWSRGVALLALTLAGAAAAMWLIWRPGGAS